jgi:hypothetical protein
MNKIIKWGLVGGVLYGVYELALAVGLFVIGTVSLLAMLLAGIIYVSWAARREDSF